MFHSFQQYRQARFRVKCVRLSAHCRVVGVFVKPWGSSSWRTGISVITFKNASNLWWDAEAEAFTHLPLVFQKRMEPLTWESVHWSELSYFQRKPDTVILRVKYERWQTQTLPLCGGEESYKSSNNRSLRSIMTREVQSSLWSYDNHVISSVPLPVGSEITINLLNLSKAHFLPKYSYGQYQHLLCQLAPRINFCF